MCTVTALGYRVRRRRYADSLARCQLSRMMYVDPYYILEYTLVLYSDDIKRHPQTQTRAPAPGCGHGAAIRHPVYSVHSGQWYTQSSVIKTTHLRYNLQGPGATYRRLEQQSLQTCFSCGQASLRSHSAAQPSHFPILRQWSLRACLMMADQTIM